MQLLRRFGALRVKTTHLSQQKVKSLSRDQTIKLFRPSGARNPPKSLALFKRIVLRAQEELEAPTGWFWKLTVASVWFFENQSKSRPHLRAPCWENSVNKYLQEKLCVSEFEFYKKSVHQIFSILCFLSLDASHNKTVEPDFNIINSSESIQSISQ